MKTYNYFIVEIPTRIKDTVTTDGGLELYVDNRFKEFENRVNEAKVIAAPFKYDHGVEEGDTLYFHHHVVINDGQPLTGHEDHYLVLYSHGPETPMASQAFAFKNQQGEIKLLSGWCLLEEVDEPEVEQAMIDEIRKPVDPEVSGSARKAELQSIKQTATDCKELIIERQKLEQMVTDLQNNGQIEEDKDYSGGFAERFSK
jgi:hypothetical protein